MKYAISAAMRLTITNIKGINVSFSFYLFCHFLKLNFGLTKQMDKNQRRISVRLMGEDISNDVVVINDAIMETTVRVLTERVPTKNKIFPVERTQIEWDEMVERWKGPKRTPDDNIKSAMAPRNKLCPDGGGRMAESQMACVVQ